MLGHISRQRVQVAEALLRLHYLVSLASTSAAILLLMLVPFEDGLRSIWLLLAAAPYFLLYGRDLVRAGYEWTDLLGVYALNLLLLPVHLGGVLKSLQQGFTGHKTSFVRTPKITTRTAAPPLYIWALLSLTVWSMISALIGLLDSHWVRFGFSFVNSVFLAFVVTRFIGLRDCLEDGFAKYPSARTSILRLLRTREMAKAARIDETGDGVETILRGRAGTAPEAVPQYNKF